MLTKNTDVCLKIKADTQSKTYEIWVNHVKQAKNIPLDMEDIQHMCFHVQSDKSLSYAYVDNIYLYDDTEIYAVNETFETDTLNNWTSNGKLAIKPYPFDKDRSLTLTGASYATYAFCPVDDIVSIETKVKVADESFTLAPEIADKCGNVAVKAALYKNNLYASDGEV